MFIEKGIKRAPAFLMEQPKIKKLKNDNILPFVSTYNPDNSNFLPKLTEIFRNLQI